MGSNIIRSNKTLLINIFHTASGSLSLIGSLLIVWLLFRSKKKLKSTFGRLLLVLSISDICQSISFVFAPIKPNGVVECNARAFLFYVGLAAPLYNSGLCLYYVLTVCYEKTDIWLQTKLEPFVHIAIILWIIGTGAILLITGSFNFDGNMCSISPEPYNCIIEPTIECERGLNANTYRIRFVGLELMVSFIIIIISMIHLSISVARRDRRMTRRQSDPTNSTVQRRQSITIRTKQQIETNGDDDLIESGQEVLNHGILERHQTRIKRSNDSPKVQVFKQALSYVFAYLITYIFPLVAQIVQDTKRKNILALEMGSAVFLPLQGLFNCFIFFRPRIANLRRTNPEYPLWKACLITAKISSPTSSD